MDFSKFSHSDFDVKEWVNGALRSNKDPSITLDAHASTLVMKLQLFIQEANKTLEEESQRIVQNMPRVIREIDSVHKEATLLKDQMNSVKNDIEKVEMETAQSMKMLVELDTVKSRMQSASSVLQEADNWSVLLSDIEDIFDRQDVDAIASVLISTQHSLEVLDHLPDYQKRKRLLEELKNKLEALLSPRLIAAFNSRDIDATRAHIKIFQDIHRMNSLERYYNQCQKTSLQEVWSTLVNKKLRLLILLEEFYDTMLSNWHAEISWCMQIFPNPSDMVGAVFTQVLSSLNPSIENLIADNLNEILDPVSKIDGLSTLRKCTFKFAESLSSALRNQQISNQQTLMKLVESVHSPYINPLLQYSYWEQDNLMAKLATLNFKIVGILDTVTNASEYVGKVFAWANEAVMRCFTLTDGCGVYGLGCALETYFLAYLDEQINLLSELREFCSLGSSESIRPPPPVNQLTEIHDDWTFFQNAFRLIQTCGDILLKSNDLNTRIQQQIAMRAEKLLASPNSQKSLLYYNYLVDDDSEEMSALFHLVSQAQQEGRNFLFLPALRQRCCDLNERYHSFAFDLIFSKVQQQLLNMPSLTIWNAEKEVSDVSNEDLPSFTSPSSYITQIGDYLLNLPQHLEPFATQNNPSLEIALTEGKLPFPEAYEIEEGITQVADTTIYWLGAVVRGTVLTFIECIMNIPNLTDHAAKQLVKDIEYLCNVLEALEIFPGDKLRDIVSLLKANSTEFSQVAEENQLSEQIVYGIARIRHINL